MTVILLDFDGTIADTFDAVLHIANGLAHEYGYKSFTASEIEYLRSLSSREVLKHLRVSIFKIPFLLRRVKTELNTQIHQLKPVTGIQEALKILHQQGHDLGIVTSNSKDNVSAFLRAQKLEENFKFIYSGSAIFGKGRVIHQVMKQHRIASKNIIYVGDETRDIEAAKQTQIKVVAVCWGFNSCQALARYQPDFLIHHPRELIEIVQHSSL